MGFLDSLKKLFGKKEEAANVNQEQPKQEVTETVVDEVKDNSATNLQ